MKFYLPAGSESSELLDRSGGQVLDAVMPDSLCALGPHVAEGNSESLSVSELLELIGNRVRLGAGGEYVYTSSSDEELELLSTFRFLSIR